MIKIDEIKTIVELMSEHDLTEFKIDSDNMQLSIARGTQKTAPVVMQSATPMMPVSPGVAPATSVVAPVTAVAPVAPRKTINSPTIGTFYQASSPDMPAFIKVGDIVAPSTIVCIIEAMKVMNEIKAEKSGVIKEILVDNGRPVEFDQPLFVIE